MRLEALFLNGIQERALEEILEAQAKQPERITFLQPHSCHSLSRLRIQPPSAEEPMRVLLSQTRGLQTVCYAAEIVGWEDKRQLRGPRRAEVNALMEKFQPREEELHDLSRAGDGQNVNLLHIRRLRKIPSPFRVSRLVKLDGQPVSDQRTTPGGWAYVKTEGLAQLFA